MNPSYYDPKQAGLPTFEMVINPEVTSDIEVSFMALVDKPAIERNFLMFKDDSAKLNFSVNEEKRIISGPAMVAGSLIFRKDDSGEYNVFFSKDTIREIALKFFKKDYQKNINLFHDPSLSLEGVTIFESFVTDVSRGIQPMKGFEDLPEGSWFISAKIDNEEVWQKIKSGEVKGFSVEGIFSYVKKLSETNNKFLQLEEISFMSELKDLWGKFKEKFLGDLAPVQPQTLATDYTLKDGTPVSIDKLEAGGIVLVNGTPAPAGDLELSDGQIITIGEGGVIVTITPGAAPMQEQPDYSSQFTAIDGKFADYELKFTQLNATFSKQNELLQSLVGIVEKIIDTPTADPVDEGKSKFQTHIADSKDQKRKELAQLFKKLKNK